MTNGLSVSDITPLGERPADIWRGRTGTSIAGVDSLGGTALGALPTTTGDLFAYDAATDTWVIVNDSTFGVPLIVEDEGTPLATAADTLNFVGAGVTATGTGGTKTITIPGGAGGPYYLPAGTTVADVQAANDAAHAAGGGVVYCPAGTYTFGTVLALDLDVSLLGAGRRATIFKATANSINVVQVTGLATGGGTVPEIDTYQWIADIAFDANGHTGCDAVALLGVAYFEIGRCSFTNFTVGVNHYGSLQSEVHDCKFVGCATGILYTAQTIGYYGGIVPPNRVSVSWCSFLGCTSHAIDYSGGAQLCVEGSEFDTCGTVADATTSAIWFHSSPYNNAILAGLILRGCWFEGSVGFAGIYLDAVTASHAQQHSVTDTYFPTNDATYALALDGSVATNTLVTDRLLIASAASTRGIYRTGANAVLDLRASSGVLAGSGGVVIAEPLLDGTLVFDYSQALALRLPNLTTTQRNAIASPTAGMLIWNTTTASVQKYSGSAWADVGGGTVTSVDLSVPAEFSVSGNPVTGAGTLAIAKANESANTVWAGPTSGSAAQPTFRALTAADLPTGTVGVGTFGLLVEDGATAPPVTLYTEDGTDWIYADA